MAVGVWLRWSTVGWVALPLPFDNLRHAHSHLGYFGLLFPLSWLAWKAAGASTPRANVLWLYTVFNLVSFLGFVRAGYGAVAIVGSTVVAGVWVWSIGPLLPRMRRSRDPLAVVPLGVVLSLACVPPIALTLRTHPEMAQGLVSTFLSGLLFLVVLPSTLAAARISPGPWPLLLISGGLGALALGVLPGVPTRLGLLAYAGLISAPTLSRRLRPHARIVWLPVAAGLVGLALGLLPNSRSVALGAIHFLILGPVLATLAPHWLPRELPDWAWWLGHGLWGSMSGALVAQAFTLAPWTWSAAALAGTGTLVWWVAALIAQLGPRRDGPSTTGETE